MKMKIKKSTNNEMRCDNCIYFKRIVPSTDLKRMYGRCQCLNTQKKPYDLATSDEQVCSKFYHK